MFSKDYVMRQVQQLGQVLALVLFNKRENPEVEIIEIISTGLSESFGVSLDEVLAMDEIKITALCHRNDSFTPDVAVSLADLLMEDSSDLAQQRSFWLYSAASRAGGTLPMHAMEWISSTGSYTD